MKRVILKIKFTALIMLGISISSNAQVKIWNGGVLPKKTQGIYCQLENVRSLKSESPEFAVATAIPLIANTGFKLLGKLLANDPEKFQAEIESVNTINIMDKKMGPMIFDIVNYYYGKNNSEPNDFQTCSIEIEKINQNSTDFIRLKLKEVETKYLPVKMKKKYKLVMTKLEISISALVTENKVDGSTLNSKIIDLGTVNFNLINIGLSQIKILNDVNLIPIPKFTDKANPISIQSIALSAKLSYQNPVGETKNDLSEYLINNAESNKALIEAILN